MRPNGFALPRWSAHAATRILVYSGGRSLMKDHRLYGYRWQIRRRHFLQRNPLCTMCGTKGRSTLATVVDHITPHKGNTTLFWDENNWQSLCKHHHDHTKQRQEIHGYSTEIDPSTGQYLDPRHPSRRGA